MAFVHENKLTVSYMRSKRQAGVLHYNQDLAQNKSNVRGAAMSERIEVTGASSNVRSAVLAAEIIIE